MLHSLEASDSDAWLRIKQHLLSITPISAYRLRQLYLHIPFCFFHCSFCVYRGKLLKTQEQIKFYIDNLKREVDCISGLLEGHDFDSAFIGGGTVTVLSEEQLHEVISLIRSRFSIRTKTGEFTTELAPHGLSIRKLEILSEQGVNRVTMGIQSLDAHLLNIMRRPQIHPNSIRSLIKAAKGLSFFDVNVDLMVGVPGRTFENLQSDFAQLAEWGCNSIMVYIDMKAYRNKSRNSEKRKATDMVLKLAESVAGTYNLNMGDGPNEYNRFVARTDKAADKFTARYSTDYKARDTLCVGVGPGAKSWNSDVLFYTR